MLLQRTKMIQQGMGNGIGVLHRNGKEQQQLQHLDICEIVQTVLQKPLLQPFPVALMNGFLRHGITKILSCYFSIFPLE